MVAATLWIEMAISGGLYFLSAVFLVMSYLGVSDLTFIKEIKDYLTYLSIACVAGSYLLGLLAHRLIQIVFGPLARFAGPKAWVRKPGAFDKMRIWQLASERLQRELDYQFNFLALFTSVAAGVPTLGICFLIWILSTESADAWPMVAAGSLLLTLGFLAAGIRQRRSYRLLQDSIMVYLDSEQGRPIGDPK